jgi:adenylate kinase
MNFVLLGPPGAGKGTQAAELVSQFAFTHLSTGDVFRAAYREKDPLGLQAHEAISRGELVEDEIVIRLVKRRLNGVQGKDGVLLDGFPRTLNQAVALDRYLEEKRQGVNAVLSIEVNAETLIDRLKDRRLCRDCGRSYHLRFKPPVIPGQCNICGGELYQRSDDRAEAIRKRMQVYRDETQPLVDYYEKQGVLWRVDGNLGMDEVGERIRAIVGRLCHRGS